MRVSKFTLITFTISNLILITVVFHILGMVTIAFIPEQLELLNLPSIALVLSGVIVATTMTYPASDFSHSLPYLFRLFSHTRFTEKTADIDVARIMQWQQELRRNRNKKRAELAETLGDTLEGYLFGLAGTNYAPDQMRELALSKIRYRHNQLLRTADMFSSMGNYAPAFGMLGTLVGLINMLGSFQNIAQLGAGLSFALMTTFYGILFANMVFLPLEGKIRNAANNELVRSQMVLEGILMIQEGRPAVYIHDKLRTYSSRMAVEDLPQQTVTLSDEKSGRNESQAA